MAPAISRSSVSPLGRAYSPPPQAPAAAAGGSRHDAMAAYAVTYLISPEARSGIELKLGSNDQVKAYLNGTRVALFDAPRVLRRDQDVATVSLNKGVNTVVLKVLNTEKKWQACLRFTDRTGKPLTDLRATNDRGGE
jgi:hypothetical protein